MSAQRRKRASTSSAGCLLTYLFSTDPNPIQVSTPQTQVTGRVNTGVFSEGQTIYCKQIVIAVPIGTDATDLYTATPAASVNTNKWAVTSVAIKPGTELGLDDSGDYATFTFDCANPTDYLINYNLVFGLDGQVNQTPGDFTIQVLETSGTDPNNLTSKQCSFTFSKTTPQFYLQNFVATAPNTPTVPATEFANGADIRFAWESNGTFFQLYMKGQMAPVYAGMQTTYTLKGGVSRDTTFFLVASVTGNPGQDSGQGGYEPIYLYDSLTITISNPDLTPKSVSTSGNVTVGNALAVTGNATVGGTLGVTSATTLGQLTASGLAVNGNATVGGTLGVTSATTLGQLTASSLAVNGNATLASLAVNNGLSVSGAVGMMLAAQPINLTNNQASGVAKTDGFIVGHVWQGGGDPTKKSVAWISASNSSCSVQATGGNTVTWLNNKADWVAASNPSSLMLPVRKGDIWSVSQQFATDNEIVPPVGFYWVPLGTSAMAESLEKISGKLLRSVPKAPLSKAGGFAGTRDKQVTALVDVLDEVLGGLTKTQKSRLHKAVTDLLRAPEAYQPARSRRAKAQPSSRTARSRTRKT